jgi:hypothetical protein
MEIRYLSTPPTQGWTPGSKEAVEAGCDCPEYANSWGKGTLSIGRDRVEKRIWCVSVDCPIHGGDIRDLDGKIIDVEVGG